ncbi:IS66 family insertion sequence element accessory protein TnpA [Roseburia sp. TF10-5]
MNEWTTRFSDQKASGLTVKEWCNQNNLSIHTYNC